jgi:hypothetical protein
MAYPGYWGPMLWDHIHISALSLDELDHIPNTTFHAFEMFFRKISLFLPCAGCKHHFKLYIDKYPPDFQCADDVWIYGVNAHNAVNSRLNRLEISPDEAKVIFYKKINYIYGSERASIRNTFLSNSWRVLLWISYSLTEEKDRKEFMLNMLPLFVQTLSFDHPGAGGPQSMILDRLDYILKSKSSFQSDEIIAILLMLRNVSAEMYGFGALTGLDLINDYKQTTNSYSSSIITQSIERREADHAYILSMKTKQYSNETGLNNQHLIICLFVLLFIICLISITSCTYTIISSHRNV